MLYDMLSSNGMFGTFETDLPFNKATQLCKACYGSIKLVEHKSCTFSNRYYVYRYVCGNFRDIEELGYFETDRSINDAWEWMLQIFGKAPDGIFVRKEKMCLS